MGILTKLKETEAYYGKDGTVNSVREAMNKINKDLVDIAESRVPSEQINRAALAKLEQNTPLQLLSETEKSWSADIGSIASVYRDGMGLADIGTVSDIAGMMEQIVGAIQKEGGLSQANAAYATQEVKDMLLSGKGGLLGHLMESDENALNEIYEAVGYQDITEEQKKNLAAAFIAEKNVTNAVEPFTEQIKEVLAQKNSYDLQDMMATFGKILDKKELVSVAGVAESLPEQSLEAIHQSLFVGGRAEKLMKYEEKGFDMAAAFKESVPFPGGAEAFDFRKQVEEIAGKMSAFQDTFVQAKLNEGKPQIEAEKELAGLMAQISYEIEHKHKGDWRSMEKDGYLAKLNDKVPETRQAGLVHSDVAHNPAHNPNPVAPEQTASVKQEQSKSVVLESSNLLNKPSDKERAAINEGLNLAAERNLSGSMQPA